MIDKTTIFEITRLKLLDWSDRKIASHLRLDRTTVKKYRENPDPQFKPSLDRWEGHLQKNQQVNILLSSPYELFQTHRVSNSDHVEILPLHWSRIRHFRKCFSSAFSF